MYSRSHMKYYISFLLLFCITSQASWKEEFVDVFSDWLLDSPNQFLHIEADKSASIFEDDSDVISKISPIPIAQAESVRLNIPAFSYQFYTIQVSNRTGGTLLIQTTCFSGEYSVYISRNMIPTYYAHQGLAASGFTFKYSHLGLKKLKNVIFKKRNRRCHHDGKFFWLRK